MVKLWKDDPATKEGKYPVVFRRDGTQFDKPHFLISMHDPGFIPAMLAYAEYHEVIGTDWEYVNSVRAFATEAADTVKAGLVEKSDPDAPRHRRDHPAITLMARRGWSIAEFVEWFAGQMHEHDDGVQAERERRHFRSVCAIQLQVDSLDAQR